ncbi:bifunctional metallophosphatase/5'-nucleotidase [Stackebrandtia nassauensis]|uniref:5'-Nucleotidase domain protein n=1 Tax=Stackebrandtia nassauensis (strain DSM 44728 / CIP 108903 / NRRL B-16338 / NBRC 102104 / LLR-40K-21) TaxID=446470 RepID=D3Q2I6_STANL|nr:bifunctional metallophosphatase/5'-nucleotidase [Stackebrandtia nassauensis]ADD43919.1 5'-Nucleotidase domain protein [Stackebrandtia nassauensis DSM 44728]
MSKRTKRVLVGATAASLVLGIGLVAGPNAFAAGDDTTDIQLLAINDFHGALEPPTGSSGKLTELDEEGNEHTVEAGGAAYLATHLKQARKGHDNSTTVAAGDLIGASPFTSAAFHDEPTIESMNKLGLDVSSVGNHEFDEGLAELNRMREGGCHPDDGCTDEDKPFKGADFKYLGANVVDKESQEPELPPVWVKEYDDGAKVGFIGMTLEGTGDIITKDGNETIEFKDEVKTANFYAKILEYMGVNAIVTLLHEGGMPESGAYNYDCNSPGPGDGISGPVVDIAKGLSPKIDAVVTGHTHQAYDCNIKDPKGNDRLVTSGSSNGRLFTEINMKYDFESDDLERTSIEATNRAVTRDVKKDKKQTKLIDKYKKLAEPIANKKVGYISEDITRGDSEARESALGDLIADAQLEATSGDNGTSQIAFMNPGGIRTDLVHKQSGSEGDGVVTHGEAFSVQPFANYLTAMDLTGEQIITLLQQQYSGANEGEPQVLQVSKGFTYTVKESNSGADRVVVDSVKLNDEKLDPSKTYRVTVNSFLAGGGDGFKVLTEGKNVEVGQDDLAALEKWFADNTSESKPADAPAADRITFE